MNGGIEVDPDRLSGSGRTLQDLATRFVGELAAFRGELAGFGRPWGSDDIGSLIGAAHDEVSAWAFECFDSALTEIGSAGVDLDEMGQRYAAVEQAIRQGIDGIRQRLDG